MSKPTLESFLEDVAQHQLTVEQDNGLFRHLTLAEPGTSIQHFNITTWPGFLCISGDMGCYVFSRIPDMFAFFRNDKGNEISINPFYWSEKVQAADKRARVMEWSPEAAAKYVQETFDDYLRGHEDPDSEDEEAAEALEEMRDNIKRLKASAESEYEFYSVINDWDNDCGIDFSDWWDGSYETYTHRYLWCCYAIVWAIQQYDTHKEQQGEAA